MSLQPEPRERGLIAKVLLAIARAVLTALVLLDEIARPLYRPLADWIASLAIIARMEAWIAGLPRLAILLLLAIHFVIVEPLKLLGLVLIGRGHVAAGTVLLALAYLASFVIVERIYHAGRDKLLSYRWLAWLMTLIVALRTRALSWIRASAAYQAAMALRDQARRWWRAQLRRS